MRTTAESPRRPTRGLASAAVRGAAAGLVGVAAMTAGELLEQRLTRRPDSFVPARTLLTLLGRPPAATARPVVANHAMHWGTGVAVGALRGLWSAAGIRGPYATAWHTVLRLAVDQTLENLSGVGSPPHTWPREELAVDVGHKAVYAAATGWAADRLVPVQREGGAAALRR